MKNFLNVCLDNKINHISIYDSLLYRLPFEETTVFKF